MPLIWFILHFTAAGLLTVLANWTGLFPWRRASQAHWTERARLLAPVVSTALLHVFLIPAFLDLLHQTWFPETLRMLGVYGGAGILGSFFGTYPVEREIFPGLHFSNWFYSRAPIVSLWLAVVVAGILVPDHVGWPMVFVAGGCLAFHCAVRGLFFRYLRLTKLLRPADPRLQNIVGQVSSQMNVPVRFAWQSDDDSASAAAFPMTRQLIFSNRLLEICTDEEIATVCAHELAHFTEAKPVQAARLLDSLAYCALLFIIPSQHFFDHLFGRPGHVSAGFIVPCGMVYLVKQFAAWLSRRMERRADQAALSLQINEGVYARALEKIYRTNQTPAVTGTDEATHPSLYDRMLAAGLTPDFPRPAKPRDMTAAGVVGMACGLLAAIILALHS